MKAAEVRSRFLDFFATRGHERVHSSPLVPANDPTLLFTNAGMVQFKDVFTGREDRASRRATTSQKCVRAGGKHNDLDEVGKTSRHHTFFEMLGNFSFGDYFKEDAIAWAWELLTREYAIDPARLIVTVHKGDPALGLGPDEDARRIWQRVTGFPDERIVALGTSENFWMMGETGPMGPCSEIHYYQPGKPGSDGRPLPTTGAPPAAWDGWLEIWNLVFMQYERKVAGGPLDPLPAPSIDTGAGLERVTSVLQGVPSNYDTDLFTPLLARGAELSRKRYGADRDDDTSLRVLADHARASAFLIADGVFPDKTGRDYVLRRIFRRAVRHGKRLGIEQPFMHHMCATVVDLMAGAFPELRERASVIAEITHEEEKRFRATLDRGLGILEDEFERLGQRGTKVIPGPQVFMLYDTYGFPVDLTEIIASERGFAVDHAGFDKELGAARERSKFQGDGEAVADVYKELASRAGATRTLYHEDGRDGGVTGTGKVVALAVDGRLAERAVTGARIAFACDRTPFYGEQGGQVGDTGVATSARGATVRIENTIKPASDVIIHLGVVEAGELAMGDALELRVDDGRRDRVRANHSATHLLNLALKRVLGDHVAQKGSLVAPDKLRFDFAHSRPMTDGQLREAEDLVNREVRRNADSTTEILPLAEAKQRGAVAMFGEKYGEQVRVVKIGGESLEFCGGTHVRRAGDIGLFKILGESGIAQGVRRIEAVTGEGALAYVRQLEDELGRIATGLKVPLLDSAGRVDRMTADLRGLEREISQLKAKLAGGGARDLLSGVREIGGAKLLVARTEVDDARALRETGDQLKSRLGSGVIVLLGVGADKVAILTMVTDDLTGRVHAGKLLQAIAEVLGGKGGGRPDMAQGGGKDPSKVDEAMARAAQLVEGSLQARP